MNLRITTLFTLVGIFSVALNGAELKPDTAKEFDDYLGRAETSMMNRMQGSFLWVDESEQRLQRARAGEIIVAPVQPKMPIPIPHGLVHHWIGAAFIPGMHMDDVIATVRDYDRYADFYAPAVTRAEVIEVSGDPERAPDRFTLTLINKGLFSKHALECENNASYTRLDSHRWYSRSHSVRVQEWEQYGTSNQYLLPAGKGAGYVWSTSTMSRFEERDGGVYVEMEAIVLSRDVPVAMRELVNPIVRRVSKSTVVTSLEETRKAVERSVAAEKTAHKVAE